MRWLTIGLVMTAGVLAATTARGDDAALAQFKALHARYVELVPRLRELNEQIRRREGDVEANKAAFTELYNELRAMQPKLSDAAVSAYRAAPNEDATVTKFVVNVLMTELQADQYDRALEVAELLIARDHPNKQVYDLAGFAAFATDQFDKAGAYFAKAKAAGRQTAYGENFAPEVEKMSKLWAQEQKIRRDEAEANDLPRVKLETTAGTIVVELYENQAPNTVANFITLIEKGYYNGVKFHRVLANFMAQGGDPTGSGAGGPGYTIPCECYRDDARMHFRGTLSMAHSGRDTGGSQFFLTFLPTVHLNGKHTAFGRVIEGLDVLAKLKRRDPARGGPADRIENATVVRKRDHDYTFEKVQ